MGLKRRANAAQAGTPIAVPAWASFFSASGYATFRRLLEADIAARGLTCATDHLDHGVLWLGAPGTKPSYGLTNVARTCHAHEKDAWAEIIANHFDICLRPPSPDSKPIEFDEAAGLLKVRLYPLRFAQQGKPVYRQISDDIIAVLTFDLSDQIVTVSTAQVDRWGRSLDELFKLATENVRTEPVPEVTLHEGDDGAPILVLQSDSYFAASHSMFLERYKPIGEHGVLLVLPARDVIAWHIIESSAMLKTVGPLISFAQQTYGNAPGAISANLYWQQPDRLTRLPSGIGKDGPWFAPPQPFNDLVGVLSGDD